MAIAAVVSSAGALEARAADFNVANVVVYRIGTGATALDSSAAAVFLDEYTPTCPGSTKVQAVALPTSTVGINKKLTSAGNTTGGLLTRSSNGRFLVAAGYDAATTTANVESTASSSINRVVGRIDKTTAIDTTTALSSAYNATAIRGATSTNGTNIWTVGGPSAGTGGIRYATLGATTSTLLDATEAETASVGIFGNQLYVTELGSLRKVGTGTPTTAGQTITPLTGASPFEPGQFVFFDLSSAVAGVDTLYVADADSFGGGGFQKYSLVGTSWMLNGTIGSGSNQYVGVTGSVGNAAGVTLYATRTAGATLVRIVDTSGYNGTVSTALNPPTVCATAAANTAFRGVALAPIAATAVGWRGGNAVAGRRGVLVSWRAGRDAENLGFDVLRARKGTTRRVKVTRRLITGTALSGKRGSSGAFRFRDRRGRAGDRYFVIARAIDGTKVVHGPLIARSSTRKAAR